MTLMIFAVFKNPMDTAVLVIFAEYDKLDERKKITKQLKSRDHHRCGTNERSGCSSVLATDIDKRWY